MVLHLPVKKKNRWLVSNIRSPPVDRARGLTTHWYYAKEMQRRYPGIAATKIRIFMIDGPIWTSAGMSAGIDLGLGLFADDLGADLARVVAKILVVYHRRAGGQSQFSTLLDLDAESDRIRAALAYAKEHLSAP
jgi:transcriptional regulator GlxA family with amidase domain